MIAPCGGEGTDHDIEGVVVGIGNFREKKGGVGEVFQVDYFGEKKIEFWDRADEHLRVDLLNPFCGFALFQEQQ